MGYSNTPADWSTRARAMASEKWRQQSAVMGSELTAAIVEAARAEPGMRILDVASGTGEPALSLAEKVGPGGHVTATDVSETSLAIAERRAQKRGLSNLAFRSADVHQLPFPDAAFDRVTSRCGVMFFSDLPRALGELHRVLKPDGRIALLAWGPFEQPYFEAMAGTVLKMVPGTELPGSVRTMFRFGRQGLLAAALSEAGFRQAEENFQQLPWIWPGSAEDLWQYFQKVTVPFRPLLERIPPERRPEVDAAVQQVLARFHDGRQLSFIATVVIATAMR